jgi:cell division septation protein DedD
MRIILLSIISWLALICIAVVVIFSVLAILKITKEAIKKIGVSRNEFIISLIVSAIFVIVLSFSVLKYFVWKSPTDKISESKSLEAPLQKEEPIKEIQSQAPTQLKEQVLMETSTEQVESSVAVPPEEAVSRSEKKEPKEKKQKKLLQPLKPSKAMFTVQMGAFSDFSHAKSLKRRFNKKGYNAYITSSTTLEKGKLYKVCIGKFIEREKAKVLSEKIRNSEGLQTFVISLQP